MSPMTAADRLGLPMSGADEAAAAHFDEGLAQLQCFVGDPVAAADAAIARRPDFVMAHLLKAYLHALSTEKAAMAVTRDCVKKAAALPSSARERGHLAALGHLAEGRWRQASDVLDDVATDHPHDALAIQAGHQVDFFTGNARMLRDRTGRALRCWEETMPGYHALLGMHAFGLEETGDYARAEHLGRRAVEMEPRDGWAQHAVAHVMEMQSRQRDGIAWMRASPESWSRESFLQIHNWWHLALFHFELGETDEVLALYDGPIRGGGSTIALNMVDASAILWRLHLGGIDVGDRWQPLAEDWLPHAAAGNYAFNDAHAMMAFVGAGRQEAADELLSAQSAAMVSETDNAVFTRDVGYPLARGLLAFGDGDYAECVRLLRPLPPKAHRFGGSHAQRDVIELTLVEAAIRAGDRALAGEITTRRQRARPQSPLSGLLARRAAALSPPS